MASSRPTHPDVSRQERAFGQQLLNEPPGSGAERGAHRDFPASGCDADQQEVRNIGARDEQDKGNGPCKDQQRLAHTRDDEFLEGLNDRDAT
jgi:hypothetical protein